MGRIKSHFLFAFLVLGYLGFPMILRAGVSATVPAGRLVVPVWRQDAASGSSAQPECFYFHGVPDIGYFVGHPNTQARSDRVIVRFNIASYLLRPAQVIPTRTATIEFAVTGIIGKKDFRKIEVVHLSFDPLRLTGLDLVRDKAKVVGTVVVCRTDPFGRVYTVNVSKWVNDDIYQGQKFSGFRFRDVQAEAEGNPDAQATGIVLFQNAKQVPVLKIREK